MSDTSVNIQRTSDAIIGRSLSHIPPVRMTRQAGSVEYTILSKPVRVDFTPVVPSGAVTAERAATTNAVVESTLRLASTLSAALLAKRRLDAAGSVRNTEWENRQAQALMHLRRSAGDVMVQLAQEIADLRTIIALTPAAMAGEADVRDMQKALVDGPPAEVSAAARALGTSAGDLERWRRELLDTDARIMAERAPVVLKELQDALQAYGTYWQSLPLVPAPWQP